MHLLLISMIPGICLSFPFNVTFNSTTHSAQNTLNSTIPKTTITELGVDTRLRISATTFIVLPFVTKTEPRIEAETTIMEKVFDTLVPASVPTDPILLQNKDFDNSIIEDSLALKTPTGNLDLPQALINTSDQNQPDQPTSFIPPVAPFPADGSLPNHKPDPLSSQIPSSFPTLLVIGLVMCLFTIGSTVLVIRHVKRRRKGDMPDLESKFLSNFKTEISIPETCYRYSDDTLEDSISNFQD